MISLDIQPYCQECDGFDPVSDTVNLVSDEFTVTTETVVRCRYKKRCAAMCRHLKQTMEEKEFS